jgi:hypothetical protein
MPSTTNFGWTTPADTDLVKDGAAAIRTLGNGVDTSFVDLKGGTSGQILAKNSNTDLDFVWVANDQGDITAVTAGTGISGGGTSGAVTITNSMATEITASGDIIVGTGSGTFDNLPIGSTGQVLTADTTVSPYKVKWATPAAGGLTLLQTNTLSGASYTTASISQDYKHLLVVFRNLESVNDSLRLRFNSDTGGNYYFGGFLIMQNTINAYYATQAGDSIFQIYSTNGGTGINRGNGSLNIYRYTDTSEVFFDSNVTFYSTDFNPDIGRATFIGNGVYDNQSAAISTITVFTPTGTVAGTMYVYGVS